MILVTQAGMTLMRFETGYMTPLTFGDTFQSLAQIEQYLAVDRTTEGSTVRAYGTLASPGSTVRLCMMVIPFALLLCVRNPMYGRRLAFVALTLFGLAGLLLTFDRVYYITTAVQGILLFLIMLRDRMLRPEAAVLILLLALAGVAAASQPIYQQFTVREDSMSVRFRQYEAAVKMILENPLLGVGLNNGTGEKRNYAEVTYNPRDPETQFYMEPTHNLYLSLASEIGIVGTLLFVAFFTKAAVMAWRQSLGSMDAEIRWLANALLLVFCGVAVNGLMDPLQEYSALVFLWLYAGLALNLSRLGRGQNVSKLQAEER
jgi:O-antigen ligase